MTAKIKYEKRHNVEFLLKELKKIVIIGENEKVSYIPFAHDRMEWILLAIIYTTLCKWKMR